MKIEDSDRLRFRLMTKEDSELLWELDQDPEVMRFINGGKISTRSDIQNTMIPRLQAFSNFEKGWGLWQVNLKENGKFLGWVLVRPMHFFSELPEFENIELGWRFKREFWGQGYATEAAQHIMNAVSKDPTIKYFSAIALPENTASIKIMTKLGMSYIKTDHYHDSLGNHTVVFYRKESEGYL
ncbi:GNAT family N-acetyltransferase [Pleionea sediminis]|uniref:GNAT family N-acetyltransferase n=1 Tax=Pleionea sediminis TaxID=2569479 RepID=UPI0011871641|nr:GNAT family N-acetyltransferase [Pleionea sediminis]